MVRLRFTPRSLDLALASFCYRPSRRAAPDDGWGSDTTVLVNDRPIGGDACTDTPAAPGPQLFNGDDPDANQDFWSGLGVEVGRPVDVVLTYRPTVGGGLDPSGRLGIGVYELSGERISVGSTRLRMVLPEGDHDYRLRGYQMIPVRGRAVDLRTPVQGFGRTTLALTDLRPSDEQDDDGVVADLTSDAGTSAGVRLGVDTFPLQGTPRSLRLTVRQGFTGEMILAWCSETDSISATG